MRQPLLAAPLAACLAACLAAVPIGAAAQAWSPKGCGSEPAPPRYDLSSRAGYNEAVRKANAYREAAQEYSACVLKQAHAEQTALSRQAQDRIADIQTVAVAVQQAIYARLAAQAATFKAASAKLQKAP